MTIVGWVVKRGKFYANGLGGWRRSRLLAFVFPNEAVGSRGFTGGHRWAESHRDHLNKIGNGGARVVRIVRKGPR